MKKIFIITVLSCVILLFFGCQQQQNDKTKNEKMQNRLDTNEFPDYLVGTWQPIPENKNRWRFTFEPDGTISKFRHFIGMEIAAGEDSIVETGPTGAKAVYNMGPCTAEYNKQTRELTVIVIMEGYMYEFPNGSMEGNMNDYLIGNVSKDGSTWEANWVNYTQMYGSETTEPKEMLKTLTFKKIEESTP